MHIALDHGAGPRQFHDERCLNASRMSGRDKDALYLAFAKLGYFCLDSIFAWSQANELVAAVFAGHGVTDGSRGQVSGYNCGVDQWLTMPVCQTSIQ